MFAKEGKESPATKRRSLDEALHVSEERFRVALKNSPIVVFNQDKDLRYTWINSPVLVWAGQDYIGHTDAEIVGGEEGACLMAIKQGVLQTGIGTRVEVMVTFQGKPHYFDLTVEPLCDKHGAVIGITCAAADVTSLRQSARQLERLGQLKNELLGLAARDLGKLIGTIDVLAGLLYNDAATVLAKAQLVYLSDIQALSKFVLHRIDGVLDLASIESGDVRPDRRPSDPRNLLERTVDLYAKLPRLKDVHADPQIEGERPRMSLDENEIAQVRNKWVEDALRESQQRLVSIYNTVEDAIFHLAVETGGEFRVVSVNAAFLRLTGLSQEQVVGKTVNEVILEPSLTRVLGKYRQAIEEKTIVRWEETSDYPAGRLTGEVSVAPVFDNTGTCTHLVGSIHDITEAKRVQEVQNRLTADLERSRDEIRGLAASLMRAQEDERRRISRELHDHICHQLGSLAGEISQLAAGSLPSESVRARLEEVRARVVQTSQETQRIAYQMHTAVLDDLGLVASLKDLCSRFSKRFPDIAVDFECSDSPPAMPGEVASCFYRVAEESLQNIAKHAAAKTVSVRLGSEKRAVVLTIQDDGAGFDLKAAKVRSGLGLISMKERAHPVKGKLTITSQPGRGTRITLTIPVQAGS